MLRLTEDLVLPVTTVPDDEDPTSDSFVLEHVGDVLLSALRDWQRDSPTTAAIGLARSLIRFATHLLADQDGSGDVAVTLERLRDEHPALPCAADCSSGDVKRAQTCRQPVGAGLCGRADQRGEAGGLRPAGEMGSPAHQIPPGPQVGHRNVIDALPRLRGAGVMLHTPTCRARLAHGLTERHRRRQAVLVRSSGLVGEGFTRPAGLAGFPAGADRRSGGDAVNPSRPFSIGDRETAFLAHGFEFLPARRGKVHSHGFPPVKTGRRCR